MSSSSQVATPTTGTPSIRSLLAKLGRFGKPNQEQSVQWTPGNTLGFASAIKTDKFISALLLRFHGRITVSTASFTPTIDPLRYLLQQVRVFGTHTQFGAQTVIKAQAQFLNQLNKQYGINYLPGDSLSAPFTGATGAYDVDVVWTVPLWAMPLRLKQVPLYSLKGPDWAGNLFVSVDSGDYSALGEATAANVAFSAYGSTGGSPTLYLSQVNPVMTVDVMNEVSPAICFRTETIYDNVVQATSFTGQQIALLNFGKRLASFALQTGVLFTGNAGIRAYTALSNAIVTRWLTSLDGKYLVTPYSGVDQNEWNGFISEEENLTGLQLYNFIQETQNPDCAFPAETLTAARRFAIFGDVNAAVNQGLEVMQEEILGSPVISGAATSAASMT